MLKLTNNMNKKIIYGIIIIAIIIAIVISGDPFGAPPKGTSPNCGPENRYKFDVTINSKEDFVNFLKTSEGKILDQYGNNWVELGNFKNIEQGMNYSDIKSAEVNWNRVLDFIKIEKIGSRTIYSIEYTPTFCSPAQKFTLKMTNDGYVSVYGCCGK